MATRNPTPARYGVLLQVRELEKVRLFYRDVVGLGEPALDSNYYVEFHTPGGGLLVLQQCHYAETEVCGDTAWLYFTDDPEVVIKRLEDKGVCPLEPVRALPGRSCVTFSDPEGNLFTVYSLTSAKG